MSNPCVVCNNMTFNILPIYGEMGSVHCCQSHKHTYFYHDKGKLKPVMRCTDCHGPCVTSYEVNGINQPLHDDCNKEVRHGCRYCDSTNVHRTEDNFLECDKHKAPILKRCGSVDYMTPSDVVNDIHEMWGHIMLDPATVATNPTRARMIYEADGHKLPWQDRTFCNPPYGKMIKPFLAHAAAQASLRYRIALLLPCGPRNSSTYFQKFVFTEHLTAILMFNRRLDFGPGPAPQASMLCLYNCLRSEANKMDRHGAVLHVK